MHTRVHLPCVLQTPRSKDWRKPSACLICPNTGSTIVFRRAYIARLTVKIAFSQLGQPAHRNLRLTGYHASTMRFVHRLH